MADGGFLDAIRRREAADDYYGAAGPREQEEQMSEVVTMTTPTRGLSSQIGVTIEEIKQTRDRLLRQFAAFETARTALAELGVTIAADFGQEINGAYATWAQLQKPLGKA